MPGSTDQTSFSSATRIAWLSGQLWLAVLSSRTSAKNVRVLSSSANDAARSVSECGQPRRIVAHFFTRVTQMIKRKFGLLVGTLAFAATLLAAPPGAQAQQTGTISGRVTDQGTGQALQGARLFLERGPCRPAWSSLEGSEAGPCTCPVQRTRRLFLRRHVLRGAVVSFSWPSSPSVHPPRTFVS